MENVLCVLIFQYTLLYVFLQYQDFNTANIVTYAYAYDYVLLNVVDASLSNDRLCGPVARVPDSRSRGSGFYSLHYKIF
jgi:hypothetical protein